MLVRVGANEGRKAKPELKLGICGEHGGDPASIRFCDAVGLDYVSCSPFRVPIARLAAAQAALAKRTDSDGLALPPPSPVVIPVRPKAETGIRRHRSDEKCGFVAALPFLACAYGSRPLASLSRDDKTEMGAEGP